MPGASFKNCQTIDESDRQYKFQLFEVLITETLAVIDPATHWRAFPVTGDSGVDFIGERKELMVPYLLERPAELILGQIKRRSGGYDRALFHYDIIRMIEYYNEKYAPHKTLFQIVHILSTDHMVDPQQWLDNISYPYVQYHVSPIDAIDFFRFWRIEKDFFIYLLEGVCTTDEIDILIEYLDSFVEDWTGLVEAQVNSPTSSYIGETFACELQMLSHVDLTLSVYATWEPSDTEQGTVVMVFPHNMIKNTNKGFYLPLYKNARFQFKMKVMNTGELDLGTIHLFSKSGQKIYSLPLGIITVYPGLVSSFFEAPFAPLVSELRGHLQSSKSELSFWAVIGQGGIGKTTLVRELLVTAMNHGYYVASIACGNDIANQRQPILDLFVQLIPSKENRFYVYEELFELVRNYMGLYFNREWADPLMSFILGNKNISYTSVIECLMTLILLSCANNPVFLWISDMHWASKEVISILKSLLDTMKQNRSYFSHSFIVIFEGRDGETLLSEHKSIYPYEWIQFLQQRDLIRYSLQSWKEEYSKEFISMIIDPHNRHDALTGRLLQLSELAFRYAKGNPMHIKEYLRFLTDQHAVRVQQDGTLELIDFRIADMAGNQSIREIVLARIQFYHEKYPDIIDCYVILAHISTNRYALYNYMRRRYFNKYADYDALEAEISILRHEDGTVAFLHEHYEEQLKLQTIQDEKCLGDISAFFETSILDNNNEHECLDAIIIRTLYITIDYPSLVYQVIGLLARPASDSIAFRCYEILLSLPHKYWQNSMSLSKIYFDLSEIAIRISSWKNARKYLELLLEIKPQTLEDQLYRVLSFKSLANICGVSLELSLSLSLCEQGLDLVKVIQRRDEIEANVKAELSRQYEMLLNRIAVTYWFMGRCDCSTPYQEEALKSARNRGDTYSVAHTLYEMGVCKLHTNVTDGIQNIRDALELLPPCSRFTEPQERALVEVELLIARLLAYDITRNQSELQDILGKSLEICEIMDMEAGNYEAALCNIVQGVCHVEVGNPHAALRCFYACADLAQIGELNTILWKAYLNIAQTFEIIDNSVYQEQCLYYAKLSYDLLFDSIKRNEKLTSYQDLLRLPLKQVCSLLQIPMPENIKPGIQEPLFVTSNERLFFIMD